MCQSQYHNMSHENCLLDLEQLANMFCYNYSSFKKDIHISTFALSEKFRVVLHEYNAEHTAAFTSSDYYRFFSLDQSNYSYSAQLSVN